MGFKDRIGIDLGRSIALEDGIAWAAKNGVAYFDAQTDIAPNALESFDDRRCARIAEACARHGLHLGLHTLSAVNIAEFSQLQKTRHFFVVVPVEAGADLNALFPAARIKQHGPDLYEVLLVTATTKPQT